MASSANHLGIWFKTIEELQPALNKYHDERLIFDHYRIKFDELKYEKQMFVQRGALEPPKFTQLYQRVREVSQCIFKNEQKYEKSLENYQLILKTILDQATFVIDNRVLMVNRSLEEFLGVSEDLFANCLTIVKESKQIFKSFPQPAMKVSKRSSLEVKASVVQEVALFRKVGSLVEEHKQVFVEEQKQVSEEVPQRGSVEVAQKGSSSDPQEEAIIEKKDAFAEYDFNQFSSLGRDESQRIQPKTKPVMRSLIERESDRARPINMSKSVQLEPVSKSIQLDPQKFIKNPFVTTPFDDEQSPAFLSTGLTRQAEKRARTPFDDDSDDLYASPSKSLSYRAGGGQMIRSPEESKQQKNPFL